MTSDIYKHHSEYNISIDRHSNSINHLINDFFDNFYANHILSDWEDIYFNANECELK